MIGPDELRRLGEARWAMPVLEALLARGGARFAELAASLEVSKDSLSRTLEHLIALGWVRRNAGHGHPLRPEYLLTDPGLPVAAASARMMAARRALGIAPAGLPRWSLPLLGRLDGACLGFAVLRRDLAPVTSRALSLNLKQMIDEQLVERHVEPSFPPAAFYGLAPRGTSLIASLRAT